MGWLADVLKRNKELEYLFDLDFVKDDSDRVHMKKLAIDTCVSFLGRTISQSKFRIRNAPKKEEDELSYLFNVRPNLNMTASTFWETVVHRLVYDNECLIVQSDEGDMLIAEDFEHKEYAVKEDVFSNVLVKGWEFKRSFLQNEVIHLRYRNEQLAPLIDGLFKDYGSLFGRLIDFQMRKGQIRAMVDTEGLTGTEEQKTKKVQDYINRVYKAIYEKPVAVVPQQKGFNYREEQKPQSGTWQNVEEINKVTNGFLVQVATAIGIPPSLLFGDMADVEKQTKNYMLYTVNPLLKKIQDEANVKFFDKKDYLAGKKFEVKSISYNSIFDLATSIDKLISSGAFTGNELREEVDYEKSKDPHLDNHYITKNYEEIGSLDEGGDNNNEDA
ncbi:Portal protein [Bacillus sp. 349Y]|nr:Portal protein [Bacillus sp. 349Y]